MGKKLEDKIKYVKKKFDDELTTPYNAEPLFVSSPGRIEILGNHTDHQHGCVITSAIHLDKFGIVQKNGTNTINLITEGYPVIHVDTDFSDVIASEYNTSNALVRGIVAGFRNKGYRIGGFDAYQISEVLNGSGLSSSASFEVWVATAISKLNCENEVAPLEIAKICQYAENVYFNKPCGLQDQMACALGGILFIDFEDTANPIAEKFDTDFSEYSIVIIDSGGNHADMTDLYAEIPSDLSDISAHFDKNWLREVPKEDFLREIPKLRNKYGDRHVLRAFHIYHENERVLQAKNALKCGDIQSFLKFVKASGESSFTFLQNVTVSGETRNQPLAVVLALVEDLLEGEGAFRIQGGGFAGTIEAFVPKNKINKFKTSVEEIIGENRCHILSIRTHGAEAIAETI